MSSLKVRYWKSGMARSVLKVSRVRSLAAVSAAGSVKILMAVMLSRPPCRLAKAIRSVGALWSVE